MSDKVIKIFEIISEARASLKYQIESAFMDDVHNVFTIPRERLSEDEKGFHIKSAYGFEALTLRPGDNLISRGEYLCSVLKDEFWSDEVASLPDYFCDAEKAYDENARLRKALNDAINKPMGVVPDSALEFYEGDKK